MKADDKDPVAKNDITPKDGKVKDNIRSWLKGQSFEFTSGSGAYSYTLYRFDKLSQYDPYNASTVSMVTDDGEFAYFSKSGPEIWSQDVPSWYDTVHDYCNGCFVIYGTGKQIVSLSNVTMYPQLAHGKVGGEDIEDVINQKEDNERFVLDQGYFFVNTNEEFEVYETLSHDLETFYSALNTKHTTLENSGQQSRPDMVSVITIRYEYSNFYHTTMNWYDIFLIMVLLKIPPYHIEVIWLDGHPMSKLDEPWKTLFGEPVRAGRLTSPNRYDKMIWNGFGARSHVNIHKAEFLPFVEAFRHFVLSRFDVKDDHVINCAELRITVIWRRNYVAHPRNPSGHVNRKIWNEEDVWKALKLADTSAIVNGVQLDRLDFYGQLQLISKTDLLVGMHGAGLSHILYLPPTSGVIELFPTSVSAGNAHFRSMAKWRRLRYMLWKNRDEKLEKDNHSTEIPLDLLKDMVRKMKSQLCEQK